MAMDNIDHISECTFVDMIDRTPARQEGITDLAEMMDMRDMRDMREPFPTGLTPVMCDPWSEEIIRHLQAVRDKASRKMNDHNRNSATYRFRSHLVSIPAFLIPTIMAPIALLFKSNIDACDTHDISSYEYLTSAGFILTGVLQAIAKHYQYDLRTQHHNVFASRYSALLSEIEEELTKKKQFRTNADAFMASVRLKYNNNVEQEPSID